MVKPAVYTIDQQKAKEEKATKAVVVTEIPAKPSAPVEAGNDLEVGVTNGRCSHRARKLTAVIILSLLVCGTIAVVVLFAVNQSQKAEQGDWDEHGGKPDCDGEDGHPVDNNRPPPPPGSQDPHHEIGGDDGHDNHPHPDDDDNDDHHGGDDDSDDDDDDDDDERPDHHHDGHDDNDDHDGGPGHHHGGNHDDHGSHDEDDHGSHGDHDGHDHPDGHHDHE